MPLTTMNGYPHSFAKNNYGDVLAPAEKTVTLTMCEFMNGQELKS